METCSIGNCFWTEISIYDPHFRSLFIHFWGRMQYKDHCELMFCSLIAVPKEFGYIVLNLVHLFDDII